MLSPSLRPIIKRDLTRQTALDTLSHAGPEVLLLDDLLLRRSIPDPFSFFVFLRLSPNRNTPAPHLHEDMIHLLLASVALEEIMGSWVRLLVMRLVQVVLAIDLSPEATVRSMKDGEQLSRSRPRLTRLARIMTWFGAHDVLDVRQLRTQFVLVPVCEQSREHSSCSSEVLPQEEPTTWPIRRTENSCNRVHDLLGELQRPSIENIHLRQIHVVMLSRRLQNGSQHLRHDCFILLRRIHPD